MRETCMNSSYCFATPTTSCRCHPGWFCRAVLASILGTTAVHAGPNDQRLFPAFPGAEGAGAYTSGGRGGKVFLVTTLADYDSRREKPIAGSLRAAVESSGARLVLFHVAGYVELKSHLTISQPHITIAGQSAPGDGVCLKNYSLQIKAPDVVVRYLRVRPGDVMGRELDCISCSERNVILDHCSTSWGIDETVSTNGNSASVTVQWSLIVESLNKSVHHKGPHGYGSLISGPGEISYHHNVYAFHRSRSPRGGDVLLDFRNNLIYGWGDRAGYSGNDRLMMNYVGNWLRPLAYSKLKTVAFSPGGLGQKLYLDGNFYSGSPEGTRDNWLLIKPPDGSTAAQARQALRAEHPFPTCTVTTESAEDAYQRILKHAGAVLPARDAVDRRLIEDVRLGQGRVINSQTDVGGWPELASAAPPTDSDADGMPDEWEQKFGLNPNVADSSAHDTDGDGYPDVEEFLNGTNPTVVDAWIDPPAITSSAGEHSLDVTTVTIDSATPATEVRYTLDDSEPKGDSIRYGQPFPLAKTAIVRAKAFTANGVSHVRNARLTKLDTHEAVAAADRKPGLLYRYWEQTDSGDFAVITRAANLKSGVVETFSVSPRGREDDFAFQFSGFLEVPADGIYTIYLRCSPRGQLYVGDEIVVENQGVRREHGGKVSLLRGMHPVTMTIYYHSDVDKTLEVDLEGPGLKRQPIGAARLFH